MFSGLWTFNGKTRKVPANQDELVILDLTTVSLLYNSGRLTSLSEPQLFSYQKEQLSNASGVEQGHSVVCMQWLLSGSGIIHSRIHTG